MAVLYPSTTYIKAMLKVVSATLVHTGQTPAPRAWWGLVTQCRLLIRAGLVRILEGVGCKELDTRRRRAARAHRSGGEMIREKRSDVRTGWRMS
jgi:hypothetical protein